MLLSNVHVITVKIQKWYIATPIKKTEVIFFMYIGLSFLNEKQTWPLLKNCCVGASIHMLYTGVWVNIVIIVILTVILNELQYILL